MLQTIINTLAILGLLWSNYYYINRSFKLEKEIEELKSMQSENPIPNCEQG